jgi:fumarylacetoacetate (FAA) hydrolase
MKLATIDNGQRDGQLYVVSRDLKTMKKAPFTCLQHALDDWQHASKILEEINPTSSDEAFDLSRVRAPLPRAYEWVDGSAFINHVVLVRKARGAEPPESLRQEPLVYQGGSGVMLGALDPIELHDESWGCDFEAEVCVILDDTPQGTKAKDAAKHIKLVMLCNDVSLRNLIPKELEKGFGFFNSKPATAFSPVCVTPDELGAAWQDGRVHLPLHTHYKGEWYGHPNAGSEMFFSFFDLVEHICKTRSYTAGTIVGSGTVSNEDENMGSSCLAEKRMIEKIKTGSITTPFMTYGDTVRIEMFDAKSTSIFGAIEQKVVKI